MGYKDLKEEVAQRRRGMRYFAAGRPRRGAACAVGVSMQVAGTGSSSHPCFFRALGPTQTYCAVRAYSLRIFQGDPNEQLYQEANTFIEAVLALSLDGRLFTTSCELQGRP